MAKPTTILLVPGAWHVGETWSHVAKLLQNAGYETEMIDLPSVGPSKHLSDFSEDVKAIRSHITQAANRGQNIVVVCHSYGGIPASDAIDGYDRAFRERQGLSGGVTQLVYCTSFLVAEGQSLVSAAGGKPAPWCLVSEDGMECNANTPEQIFYNDLSEEDAKAAIEELKPFSFKAFESPSTCAAWKDVPTTYIYCLKDNAIPFEIQKIMVEVVAQGYDIRTETLDSSHSPMLSMPEQTADAIRRAIS